MRRTKDYVPPTQEQLIRSIIADRQEEESEGLTAAEWRSKLKISREALRGLFEKLSHNQQLVVSYVRRLGIDRRPHRIPVYKIIESGK